jgi:hypothetical protein
LTRRLERADLFALIVGEARPLGKPTAMGLAAAGAYAIASLIDHDVVIPMLLVGFLTVGIAIYAASDGQPLVFLIGLPALAAIAWGLTRDRARGWCCRRWPGWSRCS